MDGPHDRCIDKRLTVDVPEAELLDDRPVLERLLDEVDEVLGGLAVHHHGGHALQQLLHRPVVQVRHDRRAQALQHLVLKEIENSTLSKGIFKGIQCMADADGGKARGGMWAAVQGGYV